MKIILLNLIKEQKCLKLKAIKNTKWLYHKIIKFFPIKIKRDGKISFLNIIKIIICVDN